MRQLVKRKEGSRDASRSEEQIRRSLRSLLMSSKAKGRRNKKILLFYPFFLGEERGGEEAVRKTCSTYTKVGKEGVRKTAEQKTHEKDMDPRRLWRDWRLQFQESWWTEDPQRFYFSVCLFQDVALYSQLFTEKPYMVCHKAQCSPLKAKWLTAWKKYNNSLKWAAWGISLPL